MTASHNEKITDYQTIGIISDKLRAQGKTIAHCHGCFDIVHPGHVRHLTYASEQADILAVSLTADDFIEKQDGSRPYIPQELRAENLAALSCVDYVIIANEPSAEGVLLTLKPDFYFKGEEYENSKHPGFLSEKEIVESHGGQVIFSSGEVVYSSTKLVDIINGTPEATRFELERMNTVMNRWGLDRAALSDLVDSAFPERKIAVVGDSVWDHYIFCEARDVAKEAPMLSVKPLNEEHYPGAAAIIALTLKAMGAETTLFTGTANDHAGAEMHDLMKKMDVHLHSWENHKHYPIKTRYLNDTQKLFKVDLAENQPLNSKTRQKLAKTIVDEADQYDAIIFADFGYGLLSPVLIEQLSAALKGRRPLLIGDVSGTRRSLLAYKHFDLICPTEDELRSVMGNYDTSLPTLASLLMRQLSLKQMLITMNKRGCVMFQPRDQHTLSEYRLSSEYLPSLATHVIDPIGAGDVMLATTSLALCSGVSLNQASYLGSLAASIEVDRIGNQVITRQDLLDSINRRPELS